MRVVLLDDYQGQARSMADWTALPAGTVVEAISDPITAEDALVQRLAGATVLVTVRERTALPERVLAQLPHLRLVVSLGPRNAAIDVAACARLGIATGAAGGAREASGSTAETAWALILGWHRRLASSDAALRQGRWQPRLAEGVQGRVLGLVGLGRIGRQMARIGQAFGMEVIAWSPNLTAERASAAGVRAVAKAELFAQADVVSLHLVLAPSTAGIVGATELAAMKPEALLVNTARAALVEEPALLATLHERRIGGAALDVFWQEPLPAGHALLAMDHVLLSPHLGYATTGNLSAYYRNALALIQAWHRGEAIEVMVNP